ncbi:MAG: NAD(+)/NADH kinase, partial [Betaproteobacteria bacterium]|nr:NAD(+)/NADH kinase [Betaproteobacteria bacterium]
MTTSRSRSAAKPKKILLAARNRGRKLLIELAEHLLASGHRVLVEEKAAGRTRKQKIGGKHIEVFSAASRIKPDLAISLGGDGSFIHIASAMAPLKVPVTGVNLGKVGFLADIAAERMIESVDAMLAGSYRDEKRMLMSIRQRRAGKVVVKEAAINDLVISRGDHGPLMSLDVTIGGRHACHIRADGVIVSTPSGSTAYGMAAGGPIIAPGSDCIGIIPLNPHS